MKKNIQILCVLFPAAILFLNNSSFAQAVTIDLSAEHQIIRGFGGMNHTTWIADLNEDNREKAFGNDPGEIGLSILRCHIDPSSSNFSRELPSALHALENGAIVFASPWNAPDAMLDPGTVPSRVDPAKYGDYVAHLNSFNSYMASEGAPLYAISVQNEPDYGEWTRWTSAEMLDFMSNYAQGIENKVLAPESFQFRRPYTDPLLNDAAAAANLEIVGGHIYGGGLFDYPLAREKGKDVWMTEHLTGSDDPDSNTWDLALGLGKEISDCMDANFNAYVWWYIRRFYGLIADDGNITDKGYVISQYSKFVRKGAVRVGVDDSSLSMVDVTAYKTDTSLVIVVLNRNNSEVSLDFNISNSNVSKLTQFTTSVTKKMENDGEYIISGNSFSATIAAKSVTTFSSNAAYAGKQGNLKPLANAGEDMVLDDTEGTGFKVITLDGSSSTDSDGEIINYSWSLSGQQVSWESGHELTINIGEYELVLSVTDNDGATDADTVKISFSSSNSTEIWLDAECGNVGSNWQILSDASASGGTYLATAAGYEQISAASTEAVDLLTYDFSVVEASNYKVWGRVITPSPNDDSFWVKVDESEWVMWNSIPAGASWHWDDVHNQSNDNVVFYDLESGDHTLSICMREDGAKLDKILISNTGITPVDLGGEAINCPEETSDEVRSLNYCNEITVYPNPSSGSFNVEWNSSYKSIQVINDCGQSVFLEDIRPGSSNVFIGSISDPGVYFILLRGEKSSSVSKFIIK